MKQIQIHKLSQQVVTKDTASERLSQNLSVPLRTTVKYVHDVINSTFQICVHRCKLRTIEQL